MKLSSHLLPANILLGFELTEVSGDFFITQDPCKVSRKAGHINLRIVAVNYYFRQQKVDNRQKCVLLYLIS